MGKNKDVENFGQVKMIFGAEDAANPRCPHGPSLLMEREDKRFYACSAYRFVLTRLALSLVSRFSQKKYFLNLNFAGTDATVTSTTLPARSWARPSSSGCLRPARPWWRARATGRCWRA
jgi:hypothetical protein